MRKPLISRKEQKKKMRGGGKVRKRRKDKRGDKTAARISKGEM